MQLVGVVETLAVVHGEVSARKSLLHHASVIVFVREMQPLTLYDGVYHLPFPVPLIVGRGRNASHAPRESREICREIYYAVF